VIILGELELWPNLISIAKRNGLSIAIVNARLGEKSFRGYMRIRPLVRNVLRKIDLMAVQTESYRRRFLQIGARDDRMIVSGSIKFDGATTDRQNPRTMELRRLARIQPSDVVFLAGSTQHPEEELALATYATLCRPFPELRLILVPRHVERFESVARMLDAAGVDWVRRSDLSHLSPDATMPRIILVNTIGELSAWWGTAQIAFVGGSMGNRGGQNMIEPAAYGAAVSFGPHTTNFRDVVQLLLEADGAKIVQDGVELTAFVRNCLERPGDAAALGKRAQATVLKNMGALQRTMSHLAPLIEASDRRREPEFKRRQIA
jgi:3-deoxy-D-manno-octulosonic-acid transferase